MSRVSPKRSPYRITLSDLFNRFALSPERIEILAGSKRTKIPRCDKRQIMSYPVVMPDEETRLQFSDVVNPMLNIKHNLFAENRVLAAIRDAPLPKLMSGEVEGEE
jgi:hypothetical protein